MFLLHGRRRARANQKLIGRLYDDVVAAVRRPAFYVEYGVADTFAGRFELLSLLAGLVLRRLNEAEPPGPDVAQELVDTIFRNLDPSLRELGVGDLAVPKRMKRLVEAFLGRSSAYDAGLRQDGDALAAALSRNLYDGQRGGERMARYARSLQRQLEASSLDDLLSHRLPFPDPEVVA